jgi:glyoxylase-like metal-dependent hydrolase (beta-lactamase superfamily II)
MTPHVTDGNLQIYKIKCGPYDNNAYLVVCSETRNSVIIDTPADPSELIAIASTTEVKAILITHNHMDHLLGFEEVTSSIKAPVGIGKPDSHVIPRDPDFYLEEAKSVTVGNLSLTSICTPGHTDGSTCLRYRNHLFTGDTLFPGGPGKSRSAEALDQMIDSIKSQLFSLPTGISFYPGHGDDGDLDIAREEYEIYASKQHAEGLHGDVEWLKS